MYKCKLNIFDVWTSHERGFIDSQGFKIKLLCVIVALIFFAQVAVAQESPEANSTFFEVRDYYYLKKDGNYEPYFVSGYRQAPTPGATPILFLLPTIGVKASSIRYFRNDGTAFEPTKADAGEIVSISISPSYSAAMPSATQIPGIAAALEGLSDYRYLPPPIRSSGQPVIASYGTLPEFRAAIYEDYAAYQSVVDAQQKRAASYSQYQKRGATLTNVEVKLVIGGDVVASRTYSGSLTNMGQVTLTSPTLFQVNQIREGNFELEVASRFRDGRTSSISAWFDTKAAIHAFVNETQEALTKSRTSGFQIFGIGKRRSRMSTSIQSALRTNDSLETTNNSRVVMYDATDEMVMEFERVFFPSLSRQEVIDRHLSEAAKAREAGNLGLAKLHTDYANAILEQDQIKEVDGLAAAAALSAGDYAGFLASGVRAIDSKNQRADTYRRLENRDAVVRQSTNWDQVRTVTVNREVSVLVPFHPPRKLMPRLGLCGVRQNVPFILNANRITRRERSGLLITCVEENSPAAEAGLYPGMVVLSAGDITNVATLSQLDDATKGMTPGEVLDIVVLDVPGPYSQISKTSLIEVRTKSRPLGE